VFRPIAAGLAAVVLLTACGPDDAGDTKPADFARSVCAGLTNWRDGVAADSAELGRGLGAAGDVAAVRSRYGQFFTSTVRRTDQLIRTVDAAELDPATFVDAEQTLMKLADVIAATYFTTRERAEVRWEALA